MNPEIIGNERQDDIRALRMLNSCFRAVIRNSSEKSLLEDVCAVIVDEGGYSSAWIGIASKGKNKSVRFAASAGIKITASDSIEVSFAHNKYGRGPCGRAMRTGQIQVCEDIPNSSEFDPWRGIVKRNSFKSSASFPLLRDGSCLGAVNVLSRSAGAFSQSELDMLQELADNLAYGISAIRSKNVVSKTERRLRDSEERLKLILQTASDGSWEWDIPQEKLFLDKRWLDMMGVKNSKKDSGDIWRELIHPEDRMLFDKAVGRHLAGETEFVDFISRVKDSDGNYRTLLIRGIASRDELGMPVKILGSYEDITEKMRLYKLKEELEFRQMLIDAFPFPLAYQDNEGKFLGCNAFFEIFTKLPKKEILGRKVCDVFPEDAAKIFDDVENELLKSGGGKVFEHSIHDAGTERHFLVTKKVFEKPGGGIGGVVSSYVDITERKAAEKQVLDARDKLEERVREATSELSETNARLTDEIKRRTKVELALRESERQYRILTETAQVGIWQLSPDGIVEFVNLKMLEMLEMENSEEIVGKPSESYIREDTVKIIKHEHIKNLDSLFTNYEAELEGCKGGVRNVIISGLGLFSESGKFQSYIETFTDITDKKRAEEAVEIHKQQLMQADKMASLGFLVAGVAHEINNPANFIMLNTPILKDVWQGALPVLDEHYERNKQFLLAGLQYPEMKEMIPSLFEGIIDGVDRIRNIVSGLKDYARPDEVVRLDEDVDLNRVVEKSLSLLSSMIKKSTFNFKLELAPDMRMIKGNFQRIEQIIINLVQNACQALPNPHCGLSISTKIEDGQAVVLIEDGGKGISEKDLPHVSDPFFSTKRESGGTGLGLAIVSGIVKELKGNMKIDSEEGRGSVVRISFPALNPQ